MRSIALKSLQKRFGDTVALKRADLTAQAGQIVAIFGENGAGKSTLMSLLAGSRQPSAGEILIDDHPVEIDTPHRAFDLGIRTVFRELSLLADISVAENLYLGEMPLGRFGTIDWRALFRNAAALMGDLGLPEIDVTRRTGSYPVAIQQMIEIARAIQFQPQLLILDEPTGVLTQTETELLFAQMARLRAAGAIIFYISHRLDEVLEVADKIVVLKDGETVDQMDPGDTTKDRLIHAMVGRPLTSIFPKLRAVQSEPLMSVDGVQAPGVSDVSFTLNRGEILGFSGLFGAGRTELMRAIFGANARSAGTIRIDGTHLRPHSPRAAMAAGIGFVTEERKQDGLALDADVLENIGLASMRRVSRGPFVDGKAQRRIAREKVHALDVRPAKLGQILRRMSGGNQQKVILGKWLLMDGLKVLILDEPTRGVDIATKVEIYRLIAELAADGLGILLISSDMPEILGLSHRILVMRDGHIAGELAPDTATEHALFRLAANDSREEVA